MQFSTLVLALNLSGALAFPLIHKRQSAVESSVVATATAVVEQTIVSAVATASASASGASSSGSAFPRYPCPAGYSLSYTEVQRNLPYSFDTLAQNGIAGSWSYGPQYAETGPMTPDVIGAPRTATAPTVMGPIMEVLVNSTQTESFYQADSNLTMPIMSGAVTISNWSYVQQVYANDTAGPNESTIKLFANACGSDQAATEAELNTLFTAGLDNIEQRASATPSGVASGAASGSSIVETATLVATIAVPPPITQTATSTATQSETSTLVSVNSQTVVSVDSQTVVSTQPASTVVSVQPTTETAISVSVQPSTIVNTETATSVQVSSVVSSATETQISVSVQPSTIVNTQTEVSVSVQPTTVVQTAISTVTPQVVPVTSAVQVTSDVVVQSTVTPAPSA